MDEGVAIAFMILGGALAAFQAPLNAGLADYTGRFPAALVSFVVGAFLLAVLVAVTGNAGRLTRVVDVDVVYLLGGVVGGCYVTASLIAVSVIGAGALSAAVITGQLAAAVLIIDRLGILGLDAKPLSFPRVAGVVLLMAGTYAVTWRTSPERG